jgi:IKI3 family
MAYFLISLSQKDPAEHLLELERYFLIQPEAMQQHAIDAKLGRHQKALKNAVRAGKEHHETALKYAQSHGLLRQLLDLLHDDPDLLLKTRQEYAMVCIFQTAVQ